MIGARPRYLIVSGALHLALFACGLIAWPFLSHPVKLIEAAPVTLVVRGPPDVRPAEKAEEAQRAAAPEPAPTPEPPPPEPTPTPIPKAPPPAPAPQAPPKPTPPKPTPRPPLRPQPTPRPTPPPEPPPPEPAPPKPAPKPPSLDLNALAASTPKAHARTGDLDLGALAASAPRPARPKAPERGPARGETDLLTRLAAGRASALSADALSALQAKLNRLWNPNCEVEGGGGVIVRIGVRLGPDGRLLGAPTLVSQAASGASAAVVEASAGRALSAVRQGEPYTEIPRDGPHDLTLRFDAKTACLH